VPAADAPNGTLLQLAETLDKRSRLATEIIKGVILPQFVILPLAVLLVWFALARGIQPLDAELQQRIRRRESTDLSPIAERDVPEEVAPLVRAINDLLAATGPVHRHPATLSGRCGPPAQDAAGRLRTQAELAEREIDSGHGDPQTMKHSLRQIALSSQRAAHMVNQLLAMARAEDKEQALACRPLDLAEITRETVRDFVPRAMEKRIDLGYEGPSDGDRHRSMACRSWCANWCETWSTTRCNTRRRAGRSRPG
jgi:two-component system sensor histidine kinase TctE